MDYEIREDSIIFKNIKDFSLEETFLCGQAFRFDRYENGFCGFILNCLCYIYFIDEDLYVKVLHGIIDEELVKGVYHFLSLDVDYKYIKELFSQNEVMKTAISYAPGIRVLHQDFFEVLITFIISQNNNIPRIKKLADCLACEYGSRVGDSFAFPTAIQLKNVTEQDYIDKRFGFRAKYIFDAVQKVNDSVVNENYLGTLQYADAQKYLMQIKGVGPKVADCVLLFGAARYESFPKDVWINRAMEQLLPLGLPPECKGYEGLAQQYIFHYARFNIGK